GLNSPFSFLNNKLYMLYYHRKHWPKLALKGKKVT
ncbi:unnamed protein product, partial [marine sediment metagenome]